MARLIDEGKIERIKEATIELVVDLVPSQQVERLPDPKPIEFLGLKIPCLRLHAFDATTALKISLALVRPHFGAPGT